MIFNSFNFLILYPLLFLAYYLLPAKWNNVRNIYLLMVSYALYMQFAPAFALVLLYVTAITYATGLSLSRNSAIRGGRLVLLIGALLAFVPLLVFKYYNFINDTCYEALSACGLRLRLPGLNWAVPVGISFFTFQAIGYVADIYHKRIAAERNALHYALFLSFFPSIVSGPINKAALVLPQIKALRPYFDYKKAISGLRLLLWGMFMKVVVADRAGLYVDTVIPDWCHYTGASVLLASVLYTIQIYADFGGYSLMAIGVGRTFGFELTENFRRPYLSVSVTDFWRRWHISLSTWLKDYVYIPLGGSRCSRGRNYLNILITFLVSGIWHGANFTFIVWGLWHGVFQVIEKALGQQQCKYGWMGRTIKITVTFILVNFAWVFFRMPTLADAIGAICRMFDPAAAGPLFLDSKSNMMMMALGLIMLIVKDFTDEFCPTRFHIFNNRNLLVRWAGYLAVATMIALMGVFDAGQFIYANF